MTNGEERGSWTEPSVPSIGTGEGEVPLATPQEQDLRARTMESDAKSIAESGGGEPQPFIPPQPTPSDAPAKQPETPPAPPQESQTPPPQPPPPQKPFPVGPSGPVRPVKRGGAKKGIFTGLLVFIIIIGIGAAAYFFIFPAVFDKEPPVMPTIPQEPILTPAERTPTEEIPPIPEEEQAEEEAVREPEPLAPLPETLDAYLSLFGTPADLEEQITVESVTVANIKDEITFDATDVPLIKELTIRRADGGIPSMSALITRFAPQTFTEELLRNFDANYAFFAYSNSQGTWPGIVVTKAGDSNLTLAEIKNRVALIEAGTEPVNFYLQSPGEAGEWRDGNVLGLPARYLPYASPGASFQVVWFDNYLIFATNWPAAQEAAKRLGYE